MELSFGEILLILIIAFLVLGPKEMVKRAHQMGQFFARMRNEVNNFKNLAQREILYKDEIDQLRKQIEQTIQLPETGHNKPTTDVIVVESTVKETKIVESPKPAGEGQKADDGSGGDRRS